MSLGSNFRGRCHFLISLEYYFIYFGIITEFIKIQFFRLPFILSGFSVGSSKCKFRKVIQKRKEHH